MRLCILTTPTAHHCRFVAAMADHEVLVISETRTFDPGYDTAHAFERQREAHEAALWFDGRTDVDLAEFAETIVVADANDSVATLQAFSPDLTVVFGTCRLGAGMIGAGGDRLLNLHGGDPERYRGLDTHLWAVWHRDFTGIVTCLHRVAPGLDAGDVVATLPVDLARGMPLHALRAANTATCIRLARLAVAQVEDTGRIISRPQSAAGRYYGAMPSCLKDQCVTRFVRFTETL